MHLVFHERNHRVGNADTVNQQNWINREEVEQGDETPTRFAKVFLHHISDVLPRILRGKYETRETTVCEIGHRPDENSHDDKRPESAHTGINRQKEYARAPTAVPKRLSVQVKLKLL